MAEFPWGQLITAFGTLGGAAIGGLMSHWLTRDKHKRDRTWEKRVEALGELIHAFRRGLGIMEVVESYYDEDPHRAHESKRVEDLRSEAWQELAKASAIFRSNSLLLSREFCAEYEQYLRSIDEIDEDEIPPMIIEQTVAVMKEALPKLEERARIDVA